MGISIRRTHYHDQIDLLKPSFRGANDYRNYEFNDLLLLQQILYFREVDIPLNKINHILNDHKNNPDELIRHHHRNLEMQIERVKKL